MARVPTFRELLLLLRAVTLACAVRLALWIVPFAKLRRVVAGLAHPGSRALRRYSADQLVWAVRTVSRHVPRATCLVQALGLRLRKNPLSQATEWVAIPSYPGVRLWPETSDGIFRVPPETAEIAQHTDKRRVSDPALVPFAEGPSSLSCLYFLDDAEEDALLREPALVRLTSREAFMKLLTCAFSLDIRDNVLLERQFDAIGEIARLPCFHHGRDFATLAAVQRLVVDQPLRS